MGKRRSRKKKPGSGGSMVDTLTKKQSSVSIDIDFSPLVAETPPPIIYKYRGEMLSPSTTTWSLSERPLASDFYSGNLEEVNGMFRGVTPAVFTKRQDTLPTVARPTQNLGGQQVSDSATKEFVVEEGPELPILISYDGNWARLIDELRCATSQPIFCWPTEDGVRVLVSCPSDRRLVELFISQLDESSSVVVAALPPSIGATPETDVEEDPTTRVTTWRDNGRCRDSKCCVRCGGPHHVSSCETSRQAASACRKCGENHAARYAGCPASRSVTKREIQQPSPEGHGYQTRSLAASLQAAERLPDAKHGGALSLCHTTTQHRRAETSGVVVGQFRNLITVMTEATRALPHTMAVTSQTLMLAIAGLKDVTPL